MIEGEPLEPLAIDDRSPGERMLAGGRASLDRLGQLIEDQRFDVAALLWMLCTITVVACEIYAALKFSGGSGFPGGSGWEKVSFLGNTGGPVVALSCVVGVALAALFDTIAARWAEWLAALGGAWVVVAGLCTIASSAHSSDGLGAEFSGGNRAVGIVSGFAFAGFGLVVVLVAWRVLRQPGEPSPS